VLFACSESWGGEGDRHTYETWRQPYEGEVLFSVMFVMRKTSIVHLLKASCSFLLEPEWALWRSMFNFSMTHIKLNTAYWFRNSRFKLGLLRHLFERYTVVCWNIFFHGLRISVRYLLIFLYYLCCYFCYSVYMGRDSRVSLWSWRERGRRSLHFTEKLCTSYPFT
jgi:hypothetical protein